MTEQGEVPEALLYKQKYLCPSGEHLKHLPLLQGCSNTSLLTSNTILFFRIISGGLGITSDSPQFLVARQGTLVFNFQQLEKGKAKPLLQEGWRTGFQADVNDFIYCSGLESLTFFFSPNGRAGDTRHQLGADGKKWSTSSTLRILSYSPQVTASCIIQHPALRGQRLMASFPFQDLPSTGTAAPPALPLSVLLP